MYKYFVFHKTPKKNEKYNSNSDKQNKIQLLAPLLDFFLECNFKTTKSDSIFKLNSALKIKCHDNQLEALITDLEHVFNI